MIELAVAPRRKRPSSKAHRWSPSKARTQVASVQSEGSPSSRAVSLVRAMELAFATERLRTLCADHTKAVKVFGEAAADALRTRLADLRAVTYVGDLPTGRPEILEGDPPHLRFQLADGWYMVAKVSHERTPRTPDGTLDLARIRRALVLEVQR